MPSDARIGCAVYDRAAPGVPLKVSTGITSCVPQSGEMQWSGKETGSVYTQIPVQPAVLVRENRKGHDSYTGFSLNIKWSEVF